MLHSVTEAVEKLDLPSVDAINTYIVSRAVAAHGVKVALSGLGGDELFGGYPSFRDVPRLKVIAGLPRPLRRILGSVARLGDRLADLPGKAGAGELARWRRRFFTDDMIRRAGLPSAPAPFECPVELPDDYARMSWAELTGYMRRMLLRDADQMSMAVSLELRVPFLDHELVEYVLGLPEAAKKRISGTQGIACGSVPRSSSSFRLSSPEGRLRPAHESLDAWTARFLRRGGSARNGFTPACSLKSWLTKSTARFSAAACTGRVCGASSSWATSRSDRNCFALRMKILRSIHSVNPAFGGPIESVKQSSAILARRRHEVEIISLDAPTDPWVRDFPMPVHALGPGRSSYGYRARFSRWIKERHASYDAVIVQGIWQYSSFGVWRALRGTPTPYFVFPHGMLDPWFKRTYPLKHLKKLLYWPWAEYRVLRDASAVLFTSEEERRLARESFSLYRCNEVVVNYGTATPEIDLASASEDFFNSFPQLRGRRFSAFPGSSARKEGLRIVD